MQAVDTEKLKTALEELTLSAIDLKIDWASLGDEVEATQALMIVESACLALSGGSVDAEFDEPAIMPWTRFNRNLWYAAPSTRALLELFYDIDKDTFIQLQGTFRHIEKNDPSGRRSRNWDGEFVNWALWTLRETREATEAVVEPVVDPNTDTAAPLPDVDSVNLGPITDELTYRLGYGRIFAGRLRADWWPSDGAIAAATARGVPIGFVRNLLFVKSFISVYTQERHDSTRGADAHFVKYITDRFQRTLRLSIAEVEREESRQ